MGKREKEFLADLQVANEAKIKAEADLTVLKAANTKKLTEMALEASYNATDKVDPEVFDKLAEIEAKDEQAFAAEKLSALEKFQKRRLNAHEAKNLADASLVQLNRVYKTIKEMALEGLSRVDWCVDYVSNNCIDRLLKELELDGYQVDYQKRKHLITITW
jgi:hypothetical protein